MRTWTMQSKHITNLFDANPDNNLSRAFDFALVKDDKIFWDVKASMDDDEIPDYIEAGLIGESLGLRAGFRFKSPDYAHLELV